MSGLKRSAGVLLLVLATAASGQTAQDNLKKARTMIAQSKFAPGLKLVEKATAEAGNDLETSLELLELQGVALAGLKRAGPAKTAFQKLLSLSPTWNLNRKGPAAALKAFADARSSAEQLAISPAPPDMSTGRISEIAVDLKSDPYKLAQTILFNYRVGGGKWKVRAVPTSPGRVVAKVDAADKVEWYATVLGANDAELVRIRNVDAPITHTYQAPSREAAPAVAASDAPRRADEAQLTPSERPADLELIERGTRRKGWVLPISLTMMAAGAGAAGVGTYFALQSANARRQFATATGASGPVVLGLTRQQALELDSQARNGGMIANTLWISAGALVLTGLAVALFGPDEAVQ